MPEFADQLWSKIDQLECRKREGRESGGAGQR